MTSTSAYGSSLAYIPATAWPTRDECRELDEPVTMAQARAGFGYRGLGMYHHTPNPPDVPLGERYRPRQLHPPRPVPADVVMRPNGDLVKRPIVSLVFLRPRAFPNHLAVRSYAVGPVTAQPIACLYEPADVDGMLRDFDGRRWLPREGAPSADGVLLGVWA